MSLRVGVSQSSDLPRDSERFARAMVCLEGLSCGDGFGECFFGPGAEARVERRELPPAVWRFTDDTMMAISVVEELRAFGGISEARLVEDFARRYDPARGYGPAMDGLLRRMGERDGAFWAEEARALFGGMGSMGNGAAMRVAPLGAYFADDLRRLVEEARRSAVSTHAHLEASAGAIATAVGAAVAWRSRGMRSRRRSGFWRRFGSGCRRARSGAGLRLRHGWEIGWAWPKLRRCWGTDRGVRPRTRFRLRCGVRGGGWATLKRRCGGR